MVSIGLDWTGLDWTGLGWAGHSLAMLRKLPPVDRLSLVLGLTQRTKFTKADAHVCLLEDVAGLGRQGEIVLAGLGHTRNYLVPFKLAYYLPRTLGRPLLPAGWEPPIKLADIRLEFITPAFMAVPYFEQVSTNDPPTANAQSDAARSLELLMSQSQTRTRLEQIPILELKRLRINTDSERFFGSVTPIDISAEIKQRHDITVDPASVLLATEKIKELGSHDCKITFKELDPINIRFIVLDSKSARK